MKRHIAQLTTVLFILITLLAAPAHAQSGTVYVVRAGDSMTVIAARHGLTATQLAAANGLRWNAWVYVGQRLRIPGVGTAVSTSPVQDSPGGTYTIRPGDTLIGIAGRHGVTVSQLAAANGLRANAWVYVGQRLKIPDGSTPTNTTPTNPTPPANTQNNSGKWIDINLSTQTLTAYSGQAAAFTTRVSTGTWRTPTVAGTFHIYVKHVSTHMSGPGYSLPNVPYTMYFYRGYGLHGTYWHNNFGTPMSHGCVNLSTPDARWLFNWAPVGTKVVTHY
jgi:LysM repeat protein